MRAINYGQGQDGSWRQLAAVAAIRAFDLVRELHKRESEGRPGGAVSLTEGDGDVGLCGGRRRVANVRRVEADGWARVPRIA